MDKKAVSGLLVTLILIFIAIITVVVVWGVVNNLVSEGIEDVTSNAKCLDAMIQITKFSCVDSICNVSYKRTGGEAIFDGIKIIFTDGAGENNYIHTVSGNLIALSLHTESLINTNLDSVEKVELAVYFLDESGEQKVCSVSASKEL